MSLSDEAHPRCVVCSPANARGLGVRFRIAAGGGGVEATFGCDPSFEGYPGQLHGGIVCALLDGAMVHCLFELGRLAYTADLRVRFKEAVATGRVAIVRGWLERSCGRLHVLRAELEQDGEVKAAARAKFLEVRAETAGQGKARCTRRVPSHSR